MEERVIMLVDLDYFFAQCEERRNPSLKEKPVVVCVYSGRSEDSGAVSTANYIARKHGIKSGMPIYLAKKKLQSEKASFLPVDHKFYGKISQRIMMILKSYADRFEREGIDEAYMDVSRRVKGNFNKARKLAEKIRDHVKAEEQLTCSIGVGPNKLVAKIAADIQKPDGLTVVTPGQVQSFLAPLPVNRLIGVGRKTEKKMESLGIRTIGDLAEYDVQKLVEVFGKNLGNYFAKAALGIDEKPVEERWEAESISRISTLKEDTRDLRVIVEEIDKLCEDVYARVSRRGLGFKSIGIVAVMTDMSIRSRSKTFESPQTDLEIFKTVAKELFQKFLREIELDVRRVGVKVSNFAGHHEEQRQITDFAELVNS